MIQFAESHVDLMGSVTFTQRQLMERWGWELGKKWKPEIQDNLRDFMQIKDSVDPATFPNYAMNEALRIAFITDKQICYGRRTADEAKNALLIQALAYEQALRDQAALTLAINGREAVDEVPEVRDPDSGEITQEYVPSVEAIEPLSTTIEQDGEQVDNPAYVDAVTALAEADGIIAAVSAEALALHNSRVAQ